MRSQASRKFIRASSGETVLLVEDQDEVRTLTLRILEREGYLVLPAASGRDALELAASHASPIHLLLTDVVMPGLSGREVAEQLTAIRPGTRVLFMSGYTDNVIAQRGVLDPGMAFLSKPFTPETLAAKAWYAGRLTPGPATRIVRARCSRLTPASRCQLRYFRWRTVMSCNRTASGVLLLSALFGTALASGQPQTSPPPTTGPAAVASAPIPDIPYEKFVLANGLTVLVHEDHKAPIVAVNVRYHVGSKNEKAGRTGFAHLFEHLMFNGSEHFNDDYFKAVEPVGATDLNGTTNEDRTNYFQNVPVAALESDPLARVGFRHGRLCSASSIRRGSTNNAGSCRTKNG